MSARSATGDDAAYLEWHALDHLPEQYSIPALVHGQRWVSTPACRAARAASGERFGAADHVVQYLFADAGQETLDRFFALGGELRAAGRMPISLPPVELGAYELVDRIAAEHALVRAEVLPWRPSRGAYVVIEAGDVSDSAAIAAVPGVAGCWRFRGGRFHERFADTTGLHLTVSWLDDDPVAVAERIGTVLAPTAGALALAAPFEALVPWAWDRALP